MLKIKTRSATSTFVLLAMVFVVAWAVWTFFLVPGSQHPNVPTATTPLHPMTPVTR